MNDRAFSRRSFLRNAAAGSTSAALIALPGVGHATPADASPEPPWPVTVESYPLLETGRAAGLARVKVVTKDEIPQAFQQKLAAYASNFALKQCRTPEE